HPPITGRPRSWSRNSGAARLRGHERLRSDDFARRISSKFGLDVTSLARMVSVRRFAEPSDGNIHTDSKTKVITALLYFNDEWSQPGGRMRVLRSGANMD